MYKSKMCGNKSTKVFMREMEIYYGKVLILYINYYDST